MTKDIATVDGLSPTELTAKLEQLGFVLECPDTGSAVGFSSDGDGPLHLAIHGATDFLKEGNGILLWRGTAESFYLSMFAGRPRMHFDGFTSAEQEALCKELVDIGISFFVAHEDSAYEA